MNYLRFLISKVFLRQLGLAFVAGCLVLVGVYYSLDTMTQNNDHITVPDFETLPLNDIPSLVERYELRFEVLDSAKFNPNYPPFAVIEQTPKAGSEVKRGRKIYFTLIHLVIESKSSRCYPNYQAQCGNAFNSRWFYCGRHHL